MRRSIVLLVVVACAPRTAPPQPGPAASVAVPEDMPEETGPKDPVAAAPTPAPLSVLTPAPGVRVALDVRGWAAVALPDRVIVLDDDFRHLRAFDASTGAQLWRLEAQAEPRGRHTLYAVGDRVLLHAGSDLIAVDTARGAVIATHRAGAHNGADACRLEIVHGFADAGRTAADDPALTACSAACTCTRRLFRCDTGAPIGGFWRGSELHLHDDFQSEHNVMCLGAPRLFGRLGGRYLLGVKRSQPMDDAYEALAVNDQGKVLWRRPALSDAVQRYRPVGGDVATDVCWSVDEHDMVAWTCSTGHVRWRAKLAGADDSYSTDARVVAPGKLLVRRLSERTLAVELRDVTTGKQRWRRELPPDRVALAPAEATNMLAYASTPTHAWLDLRDGATLHEHTLAKDQALTRDPAGDGYVRTGGPELGLLARDGKLLQTVPKDIPGIQWIGAGFVAAREPPRFTVYRRPEFTAALTVEGNWAVEDTTATLGPAAVLLYEHRGERESLRFVVLRSD
ncbi:outer membrane protein assembly factor BamB family protein [Nannocystis bainbridge]|uniref:PQQ-binding-like beta-propeller repeat protein n=1 Tax=Nannocystis bainbridge TaxID=2995303 RepID=A0ABT5E103_9BACT|nr:PQQ-binding-like beta-propeller repeat protein [Nannocystis bainbridge]MDC0719562.1 PQQ-binding-like beta-propeller repeat protein [Nannocystis bainbridge]